MAHFCPDCKITFENRVSNCPRCGYGIASDSQSESYYINQGFTRFNHSQGVSQGVHIRDDDILNQLRGRYNNYVNNTETPQVPEPTVTPVTEQPGGNPPSNDFFSSFSETEVRTPETNVQPEPEPEPSPEFTETPRTNVYRTPTRRFGGFGSGRGAANIPWRAIIYFLLFIAVIAIIVNIWNMRFAILDSVMGFIGSLMPLALIVIGIIYLIRRIFR